MLEKELVSYGFDHEGRNYVIKIFQVGRKFVVKPYLNNMAANCITYSVEVKNMDDWQYHYGDKPPYARLLEMVEDDIKAGFGIKRV